MSLRIRRGTNTQRVARNFDLGELVYTTDTKQLYVGDGITLGGVNVLASSAGPGLAWDPVTQKFEISSENLTTLNITEAVDGGQFFTDERAVSALASNLITDPSLHSGITFEFSNGFLIASVSGVSNLTTSTIDEGNNLYYTTERVQDTVANMIQTGTHSGISFIYDDGTGAISVTTTPTSDSTIRQVASVMLTEGEHTNVSYVFNESTNRLDTLVDTNYPEIRSTLVSMLSNGTHDGISYDYNAQTFALSSTVSAEGIEYNAAQLFVNGTHDQITVDYDAINSVINLSAGPFTDIETTTIKTATIYPSDFADLIIKGSPFNTPGVQLAFEVLAAPWETGVTTSILDMTGDFRKIELRTYSGDVGTPTPIAAGDVTGVLTFTGIVNSQVDIQSYIGCQMDRAGTPTATHRPTKFFALTQPDTENDPMRILTFDSFGRLAVNQENAQATVDINGVMRLVPQTLAPATPIEGMIAVADGDLWDPAEKGTGISYPVYFDGTLWVSLT